MPLFASSIHASETIFEHWLRNNFMDYLKVACRDFNGFKSMFFYSWLKFTYGLITVIKGKLLVLLLSKRIQQIQIILLHLSDPAKTVLAFQVTSHFTKWSEFVRPCCNAKSSDLLSLVKQVIIDIEKCDLRVIAICTYDYQLNVSLFKSLAGSTSNLQLTCPNPSDQGMKGSRTNLLNLN